MGEKLDAPLLRGLRLFNERRYFEAHEEWEIFWRRAAGADAEFIQGLIQLAVAFHHLNKGNLRGAEELYPRAARRLRKDDARAAPIDASEALSVLKSSVENDGAPTGAVRLRWIGSAPDGGV